MNLIITHKNGDFDALAAVIAASKLFPKSTVILPENLQENVRPFVNLYRDLLPLGDPKDIPARIDTLYVIDTNRKERLGKWSYLPEISGQVNIFDHHPGEEDLGADHVKIEAIGATTTILLEEIIKQDLELTEFEATLFALGIYEDTGCLTYEITTSRDARALAFLWEKGLNTTLLQEYLRTPLSESQKVLLEQLIQNSELYELNQRRVMISTTRLDEYVSGASVMLQRLDDIEDTSLTIVIVQMTENIYFAARTRDNDLDLLELMAPFDVRGYPAAVTAHFKNMKAEEVKKIVIEFLKNYLPPIITAGEAASKPVFTIESRTSLSKADQLLAEKNIKGCPVIEDGKLAGIISRRDLQKGLRNNLGHAPVKGFMSRRLITASPQESLIELRKIMVENNIGRVPIVDQEAKLVGIVTRSDILRHLNFLDSRGRSIKSQESERLNETGPYFDGSSDKMADLPFDINADDEINLSSLLNRELPARFKKLLLQIRQLAYREKTQIYLVGGTIRDLLLRHPPEKDFDFVVIGGAIPFTFKLQKLLGGKVRHFEQFGTASLYLEDGLRLDLVTARKEYYPSPAALPQVQSSSLKNDLFRRDFTINTMACSLGADDFGCLYDYYNGRKDLKDKVIRVLYNLSFVDDPLRILRAIRFEQRYDFRIEPETLDLIHNAVEGKLLEKVSRQRLNQELRLIYKEPSPLKVLKRLDQLKLLPFLYPRARLNQETWQLLSRIEEILQWAGERDWKKKPDQELVYLGGLMFGLESVDRFAIIRKLHLSRERASIVLNACREVPAVLKELNREALNPSAVVSCLESLSVETILLAYALADTKTSRDHLKVYMEALKYIQPRLKGGDLKKMGLEPGAHYQKIIDSLKEAVLDGEVRTPQEELDFVNNYLEVEKRKGN